MKDSHLKNSEEDFDQWFEELRENAKNDFGYSQHETENFQTKNWKSYYEQGLTPFESVMQHLKKSFKRQNG